MDITRGQSASTCSSSSPLVGTSTNCNGCAHLEKLTRSKKCRHLPYVDTMDEQSRNSLNWEDFFGSSLELAPSLLNLYDHRIASRTRDTESIDRNVSKTNSLPSKTYKDKFDEVEYRGSKLPSQRLPLDRPVSVMDTEPSVVRAAGVFADNKKRPLSISSVSSTSLTSSPRLRKKRASTLSVCYPIVASDNSKDSNCTLVPDLTDRNSDKNGLSVLECRHSVDSGCVDGDKNGDRFFDSMSFTSSETGSFRDETDSSARDYSLISSSHSDTYSISQMPHPKHGSDVQYPFEAHTPTFRNSCTTTTHIQNPPQSSTPKKQAILFTSPKHEHNSSLTSEPSSPDSFSQTESDTLNSSNNSGRSLNSSLRQDARTRFFSNYEEHMKQPSTSKAPTAEESFELTHSPQTQSPKESSSISQSPSEAAAATAVHRRGSPSRPSSRTNTSSPTAAATKPEHRHDRSSQLSPNSDRTSRKTDRLGPASKHGSQPTSPKSGFSKTSKKKETLSETGSRPSPVYVSYVSRVVTEIIESERTYISSLENIIHGYLEPMEKMLETNDAKKDLEYLFSNIRDIYQFGCTFLSDLEIAGADPVKVAQCFVKYNKGFVIYTDYCTNYPRAVEVLTRFMQHPVLSQLCKERQLALGHGLPLGAYLLKPVQRILKYHLLLHNIVKNCEKEKQEAAILEQAFHHMTQMAHHINEMKRKHEHAVRIQEIQSQLEDYVGEDLTRLGELVLEGTFKVSGAKASRQVFLFERGLLISKMKEGGMLSCKTFIRCSNLMLVEVIPSEPLSFHIIPFDNPRAQDTLQAKNMEQKLRWCHDIKKQILESFKGHIPDNAKNLIMQLGRDHDDDYISKEVSDAGRRNQHTAPEYLEKRKFRRKSTSRLPDFRLLKPQKTKKGGNKKNENKSGEKMSTEIARRSESKSPERHHHIHSKQNVTTKRRSQSTSSSTVSLSSLLSTHLDHSDLNHAISWPVTKTAGYSSPKTVCTSPNSPAYIKSPNKFNYSRDRMDTVATEAEVTKRPASFLMARANPILSEDITQLMTRCGSTRKMQNSPLLEEDKENNLLSLTDCPDMGGFNLINRSDLEEFSNMNESKLTAKENKQVKNNKSNDPELYARKGDNQHSSISPDYTTSSSKTEISLQKNSLDQNVKGSRRSDPRSVSLPDLNNIKTQDDYDKSEETDREVDSQKMLSQNAKNMYENENPQR